MTGSLMKSKSSRPSSHKLLISSQPEVGVFEFIFYCINCRGILIQQTWLLWQGITYTDLCLCDLIGRQTRHFNPSCWNADMPLEYTFTAKQYKSG